MSSALREAAQQALECLESLQGGCTDSGDGTVEAITVWCPEVIEPLRAALAEPEGGGNLPPPLQEPTVKESLQVPAEVAATLTTTDIAWLATCRLTKLWQELGQMRWAGADEGWDRAIEAVRNRLDKECQDVLDWKAKADQSNVTAVELLQKMQGLKHD